MSPVPLFRHCNGDLGCDAVDVAIRLRCGFPFRTRSRVVIRRFVKKKNIPKKRMCLKPSSPEFSEDCDDGYHKM